MKQQENKNILVTGGLGYIGSNTVVKLFENGYNPIIIDNLSNSNFYRLSELETITNSKIHYYNGDIRAPKGFSNLSHIMEKYDINSVMHFAAFKSVMYSNVNFMEAYLKEHSQRVLNTQRQMVVLTQKNMEGRMAEAIINLSEQAFIDEPIKNISKPPSASSLFK